MEQFAETCRFILSCNYSSKIVEAIQSRCAVFRFRPLDSEKVLEKVMEVAIAKGLSWRRRLQERLQMLAWAI